MSGSARRLRVLAPGEFPDSRAENRRYWAARTPSERVAAARRLRQKVRRLLGPREPQVPSKAVRPFLFRR